MGSGVDVDWVGAILENDVWLGKRGTRAVGKEMRAIGGLNAGDTGLRTDEPTRRCREGEC